MESSKLGRNGISKFEEHKIIPIQKGFSQTNTNQLFT
jgi:hypothetical protein